MLKLRFVMCEVVRFDHVTLAPVQAASAVATDTPPLPLASQSKLASQRRWDSACAPARSESAGISGLTRLNN